MTEIRNNEKGNMNALESPGRREVVKGAGGAITLGMMASAFGGLLPGGVDAAASAAGMDCMTIIYPSGSDLKFDADYYRDRHQKLIMDLYGTSISRFELRKTVAGAGAGGPPAAFAAAINIWIADLAAFVANNQKHGKTLTDDVPNFTNAQPLIQFDKVHGEAGNARDSIGVGDTCLTILYKNGDDVRWDVDYYRTGHMPLIMRLYGPEAIKRFELRKGDASMAPGSKPAFIGSIGIYINSQAAFDAAGKQHTKALVDDVPNFSSVRPTAFPTVVHGIG